MASVFAFRVGLSNLNEEVKKKKNNRRGQKNESERRTRRRETGSKQGSYRCIFFLFQLFIYTTAPESSSAPEQQTALRRHVAGADKEKRERLCANTQTTDVWFSENVLRNCCNITS